MKKSLLVAIIGLFALIFSPTPAQAEVPGLQVNPLQYEDKLTSGKVKLGFIEVGNPSDVTINLESKVQAFHQAGDEGKLTFADDPEITAGIKVDLPSFTLGPREAIRVAFSVDPSKLPQGGVYAVIFFRTIPPAQNSNSSYVAESANIGTLLMLQNGGSGTHVGRITKLSVPFWQFGQGITGSVLYTNTDRSKAPVGFRPQLQARVLPWGQSPKLTTGLVLPGSARKFAVKRTGAYFGLLPVTITDAESKMHSTAWVFAVTGWYQWLVMILAILLVIGLLPRPSRWGKFRRRFKTRSRAPGQDQVSKTPIEPKPLTETGSAGSNQDQVLPRKLHPHAHPELSQVFLADILFPYGITNFSYESPKSGIANTTALIFSEAAELVVRIYRQGKTTPETIKTELEFIDLLHEHDVPVPTIRRGQGGHRVGEIAVKDVSWNYIVMDLIPGEPPAGYTPDIVTELAAIQARMHKLGYDFTAKHPPADTGPFTLVDTYGAKIDSAANIDPDMQAFLERAKKYTVTLPANLPAGYTHLDYDKDNTLAADGHITAILDFDDLDYAPSVVCLGYALWDVFDETRDVEQVRNYLREYTQIRPLESAEYDWLLPVMRFRNYVIGIVDAALYGADSTQLRELMELEPVLDKLTIDDIRPAKPKLKPKN